MWNQIPIVIIFFAAATSIALTGCREITPYDNPTEAGNESDMGGDSDKDTDGDADLDPGTGTDTGIDTIFDAGPDLDTSLNTDVDITPNCDPDTDAYRDVDGTAACVACNKECCTQSGQGNRCWWEDAFLDGVICSRLKPCPSGLSCDYRVMDGHCHGLCKCTEQSDCNDGDTMHGVCYEGVCGPSFCNGFRFCNCGGGCGGCCLGQYPTPSEMCGDTDVGFLGFCCEGVYPNPDSSYDNIVLGYCSNDKSCRHSCSSIKK